MEFIICASKLEDMKAVVTEDSGWRVIALSTTGPCTNHVLKTSKSP